MSEVDSGKTMILELVTELARGEGIDSSRLLFKWDQAKLVMEEFGLTLDDEVYSLRVVLGVLSQFLPFSEVAVRAGVENPGAFRRAHRDYITGALRRLKSAAAIRQSAESRGAITRAAPG